MSDTVQISRASSLESRVFSELTGKYTVVSDPVIYDGSAMISTYGQEPRSKTEGEAEVKETTYTVRIPIDSPEPKENDVIRVTASLRDPGLVGREFLIVSVLFSTFSVSRKVLCEDRVIRQEP